VCSLGCWRSLVPPRQPTNRPLRAPCVCLTQAVL
jgi:hypothetical protein